MRQTCGTIQVETLAPRDDFALTASYPDRTSSWKPLLNQAGHTSDLPELTFRHLRRIHAVHNIVNETVGRKHLARDRVLDVYPVGRLQDDPVVITSHRESRLLKPRDSIRQ